MESIRKLGDVVNTALILGGAEAIIADRDRMLLDTSSWRRLGKVTFVQDGLCEVHVCQLLALMIKGNL